MGKLNIKICGNEQEIMEGLLNMEASGNNTGISLPLIALGLSWHIDKLLYYQDLLNEVSPKP